MTNNSDTLIKEPLIKDITNPQEQLVAYDTGNKIGFYDGFKAGKPVLYIYIKSGKDRFTEVRRRAGTRKVKDPISQSTIEVEETKLFARAYTKYLEIKKNGGVIDNEKVALMARIAELESQVQKPIKEKTNEVKESEKSAKDLKAELDSLGIEYKGNASKEALAELLANNK